MRKRTPSTPEQLRLFSIPDAASVRPRRPRHRRGFGVRMGASFIALGLATAGIIGGSFAAWTAATTNPGNTVTAGTLSMTNDKPATAVFAATNVVPGDTGSGTVTITNSGTVAMAVRLTQDQMTSSGIEPSLRLKVHDAARDWCYWPTSAAGACPTWGAWDATTTLAALPIANASGGAQWAAGEAHTFTISWQLVASSPNSDQGKSGSFRLRWDGTS